MKPAEQRRVVEALILASPEPITLARLADIVPHLKVAGAKDLINELNTEYAEQDRAFEIWEVAGGYQIRTRAEFSGYLQQLRRERPLRLTKATLETLAIIAYKQPVTRGEIEEVRGVDSGAVVKTLLERRLVRIAGHKEVPGRPLLYSTSKRFLEVFGLESIKKLPSLRELEELAREQGVTLPGMLDDSVDESAESDAAGAATESAVDENAPDEAVVSSEADADDVTGDAPEIVVAGVPVDEPSGPSAEMAGAGVADEIEPESQDGPEIVVGPGAVVTRGEDSDSDPAAGEPEASEDTDASEDDRR